MHLLCLYCVSCSVFFSTPWITGAHQDPLSMEFSREEYWSDWPFPSLEYLPNPGIKPRFLALQAYSLPSEPLGKPFVYFLISIVMFFFSFYKNIVPQWIMTTQSLSSSSIAAISFIIDHLISTSSL